MSTKRRICVVTGTRADYGLLKKLMGLIYNSQEFELQLIATGTHLSLKYGNTYKEIEADGFSINHKINLAINLDTPLDLSKSTSLGITGIASALNFLKPDLLIVLGDRYEILSAAISAMFARIPIAHIHGGELTEGAIDEAIRHSLTKFSHLHFVANESYRSRVIQLGENPKTVYNVGGLGVDAIQNMSLLSKSDLESLLGINFLKNNLLVTFHPVTLEENTSKEQASQLLSSLKGLNDTFLIFTMPNADTNNNAIIDSIHSFVSINKNSCFIPSLGQLNYLSCLAQVDAVVGNSSSGITEAPSFNIATINIGDRQKGRMQAKSIINCRPNSLEITRAIEKSYSDEFRRSLTEIKNPYGDGGASSRIYDALQSIDFKSLIKKSFYDFPVH